jgi:glycerol-3-phosphate acyltransferase PlsY
MTPGAVLAAGYLGGTVPVAYLVARRDGVDLRQIGNGTVSGSALYAVSGFGALALAGCGELAKGALGPVLAGRRRRALGAAGAALAIIGHDWSPWLGFRGGRGVSLLLGATLVLAPEGTVVVAGGLGLGRLAKVTGLGTFLGLCLLPAVLGRRRGTPGVVTGMTLVAPVLAKRALGNDGRLPPTAFAVLRRLVADRDGLEDRAGVR